MVDGMELQKSVIRYLLILIASEDWTESSERTILDSGMG